MAWLLWERAPLSRYLRRRQRGFHETALQVAGRILAEPGKEARVGDAFGGAQKPFTLGPLAEGEEDLAHRTLDARPVHLMLAGNLLRQNPSTLQQTRQAVQIRDGECGLRRLDVPPAVDEHRVDPYLRRASDVRDRIVAHVDRTLPP